MYPREFKDMMFGHFAALNKAMASPKRFEILDYLSQGPKSVELLSKETEMSVANTSKHLQSLLQTKLVTARKEKNYVIYSLANENIVDILRSIKKLAESQFTEIPVTKHQYISKDASINFIRMNEVLDELNKDEFVLIDVRPSDEFTYQHIAGAKSIPIQELEDRWSELPKDKKIIAYCRGGYCLFASQAVEVLNAKGFEAYRMEEGVHEWKQAESIH